MAGSKLPLHRAAGDLGDIGHHIECLGAHFTQGGMVFDLLSQRSLQIGNVLLMKKEIAV